MSTTEAVSQDRGIQVPTPLRAALTAEWVANRRLLKAIFAFWFISVWCLPWLCHPTPLLVFSGTVALLLVRVVAVRDLDEGAEEFVFALPIPRSDHYLARLITTGAPFLLLHLVSLAAILYDLPQLFWSLFVESGLTLPNRAAVAMHYQYALVGPLAAYAWGFAIAVNTQTPRQASTALLFAMGIPLVLVGLGLAALRFLSDPVPSEAPRFLEGYREWFGLGPLVLGSPIALALGLSRFRRKEAPASVSAAWWLWGSAAAIATGALVIFVVEWILAS